MLACRWPVCSCRCVSLGHNELMSGPVSLDDKVAYAKRLRAELAKRQHLGWRLRQYRDDPVAWFYDLIDLQPGEGLAPYQEQLLTESVGQPVAARACRGAGKTMPAAVRALHFATTSDGDDWANPIAAGSWLQLTKFTWPEIHKWARKLDWRKLGREPFSPYRELKTLALTLETGEAFAINSDRPELLEGAHADRMLMVVDEAKSVPDASFEAMQGYESTDGDHSWLVISTPGAPAGWFYNLHAGAKGYERWRTFHITVDDAVNAGRVSKAWVEEKKDQWGEDSRLYRTHVLGEFAGEADGVIPLAWVEAAMSRWQDTYGDATLEDLLREVHVDRTAIDPADEGGDENVMVFRHGYQVLGLEGWFRGDTMFTADKVARRTKKARVTVDSIGIGAGVLARVQQLGADADGFVASKKTRRKDRTGEFGFVNLRSAGWWNLREMLDPDEGLGVMLPPDDQLKGDLVAPTWREREGGRIAVEPKDEIRKRLGRSTDRGDAVVMVMWDSRSGTALRAGWSAGRGESTWADAG